MGWVNGQSRNACGQEGLRGLCADIRSEVTRPLARPLELGLFQIEVGELMVREGKEPGTPRLRSSLLAFLPVREPAKFVLKARRFWVLYVNTFDLDSGAARIYSLSIETCLQVLSHLFALLGNFGTPFAIVPRLVLRWSFFFITSYSSIVPTSFLPGSFQSARGLLRGWQRIVLDRFSRSPPFLRRSVGDMTSSNWPSWDVRGLKNNSELACEQAGFSSDSGPQHN